MNIYQRAEEITLVHSGSDYFDRLENMLDNATQTIHLQVYIFAADDTGKRIIEALKRASIRGVRVWVLADDFGSRALLPVEFVKDILAAGIQFRFFSYKFSFFKRHLGRTLHHKIVVADRSRALVGGINIADKYHGDKSTKPWLDFAVYIQGDICNYLDLLCNSVYKYGYFRKRDRPKEKFRAPTVSGVLKGLIRFRENDWLHRKNEIYRSYRQAIAKTRDELSLTASYFLPGRLFRKSLIRAAKGKRNVRVLLTGPSDVPILPLAEKYMQHWLLKKGIQVFVWNQSVMHGKTMVIDDTWATVGSFNINHLSRFRSMELNVEILDPKFVRHFKKYLDAVLTKHSEQVTKTPLQFRGWYDRAVSWLVYRVFFFIMRLFFTKKQF